MNQKWQIAFIVDDSLNDDTFYWCTAPFRIAELSIIARVATNMQDDSGPIGMTAKANSDIMYLFHEKLKEAGYTYGSDI